MYYANVSPHPQKITYWPKTSMKVHFYISIFFNMTPRNVPMYLKSTINTFWKLSLPLILFLSTIMNGSAAPRGPQRPYLCLSQICAKKRRKPIPSFGCGFNTAQILLALSTYIIIPNFLILPNTTVISISNLLVILSMMIPMILSLQLYRTKGSRGTRRH